MTRTFIQTLEFSRSWDSLGLDDNDLKKMEHEILRNPKIGKVIRGTGHLRKMRVSFPGRGKSGSVRVCYVDFEEVGVVYLIAVFSKKDKVNLTMSECNALKKMIEKLEKIISEEGE